MKIKKILNNNVAVSFENKKEIIVVGNGLAFNKKVGDRINQNLIKKKFILTDQSDAQQLQIVLEETSPELTDAITTIIDKAAKELDFKQTDTLFLTLTDHINFALMRQKDDVELTVPMSWDVKHFFRKEYEVSKMALEIIFEKTGVQLPMTEAGFITLHFVNATQSSSTHMHETYQMTKLINDIVDIIQNAVSEPLDVETLEYNRLITHLNFFAKGLVFGDKRFHNDEEPIIALDKELPLEKEVVENIAAYIYDKHHIKIHANEKLFLTIHLARIFKISQK